MALKLGELPNKSNRVKQKVLDAGTFPGRVVQIIDFGLQPQSYNGETKDPAYEMGLTYEMLDEFMIDEDGSVLEDKPRWLSESFPLFSLKADKAKSTQRYTALDPTNKYNGDFSEVINTPINVNVIQNPGKGKNAGTIYNNISSISPMREKDAVKAPPLVNKPVVFVLDNPNLEVFNNFPDFIKDKIKANLEFKGSPLDRLLNGGAATPVTQTEVNEADAEPENNEDVAW